MKPDHMIEDIREQVRYYFDTEHKGIQDAAVQLLDDGFLWEQIRSVLYPAFDAGYRQAVMNYDR